MPLSSIDSAKHIVLIAHKNPDADSLGAACAFYSFLLRTQKKVTLFCATAEANPDLGFLPWYDKLTDRFPEDADCHIAFDCGSFGRLGVEKPVNLINFDHHPSNDLYGSINLVEPGAISTTEVVYDFFVANGIKINAKMALSLYAGVVDDSKCFGAPGCSAKTFAMAHDLIRLGAEHALCVEWLYNRRSLASFRLRGTLLKQMKLRAEGRLAVFDVSASLLEETGARMSECKQIVDEALAMRTVRAALVRIEHPERGGKLSLRSDGCVDAAEIMARFGGGGHKTRSGVRIMHDGWQAVADEIIMMIEKEME